ncbi:MULTISPECIES: sarcosine oxidase subunit beta [unclassified Mesorhizobium]|uniref:sarcosine oxidase subunit beta n=2 Tax=Mesorhizobium TaxID=68287 RepID=UPI000FCC453C|nr:MULTISPECIES: sarcosine oxidase subunit beta [unclassified Mesorhizobium]RUX69458.1 sarcosine oxidase subunit beta [Mesorhizobium sp. M7A.F.Ca.US.005.03.1.1]RUY15858.1 sarcosine oxidase subunit beta [Mesorhizobium sp. M7A.F.Ca.US.005.03.2.1]RUY29857.1 sarcosine oxidase subunit beta [Mesorhizobium sp. M7A.F.Ca.US.001.04.2.1]RUY41865.1 sarcosine oxidase subunit beta [Mesorhizobium sp. M7A.F.Ca.US.001.04.1.1]RVA03586.1 sarcosine oxidase subunit beta [Mesorhizobium sp. M7A.F.Ca.US.001.02.1.1]
MAEYSAFSLLANALKGNKDWKPAWRKPDPKASYDVIIIGGGGHGLATAYYLAKEHGITNVAVVEKGWLGSGNVGRNTTAVRSNYLLPANTRFYEHSMKLWENLSHELNYNVMFSQRGCLNLAHTPAQFDDYARRGNAMRHLGVDAELMTKAEIKRLIPALDISDNARFPVVGGLMQRRAGTARHDAVAWGYARGADRRGVDIIENCEVTGFLRDGDRISGVTTSRGDIRARKVAVAVAGSTGRVMQMAGIETMPIESHVLQAFVTESLKPFIDTVVTFGMGHFYMSQSDKGGLIYGGDIDGYNSYAQRGNLPVVDEVMSEMLALFPGLARVRMLRSWGGVCDMSMDGSPIITAGPLPGMYLNCGWCYGGFKATPASGWCFAWTIAKDQPHDLNAPFTLDRFHRGLVIDDKGQGANPRLH